MNDCAVIYARYSSEKQNEQSIEGQLHVCNDYAQKNNLQVVKTYIDRAKSGRSDEREAFQQMIKDSETKSFSTILVYAFDRFARNRYDSAIYKHTLKKNNVKLVSATQQISDDPTGILVEALLEGLDEYYSVELTQKLARGRRESIKKGQYVGGSYPYGYKIENKKYVLNTHEANNVKLIYDLYLKFKNHKQTYEYLKTNNIYNNKGTPFTLHHIINILTNKAYTGLLKSGSSICEGGIPVIIEKEKFDEVQFIMRNNKSTISKSPINFLLTGKLICGECGGSINGDSGTGKLGKKYYYYTCQNRKKNKICSLESYKKDELENYVYKQAIKAVEDESTMQTLTDKIIEMLRHDNTKERIEKLKKDISSINKKLTNIANAIADGIFNEKIKEQNQNLLESKNKLEYELSIVENSPLLNLTDSDIKNFIFKKYLKSNKETIISNLIYKVYLYKDKIIIIFNLMDPTDPNKRKTLEEKCSNIIMNGPPCFIQNKLIALYSD